jgi:hypothetical protein
MILAQADSLVPDKWSEIYNAAIQDLPEKKVIRRISHRVYRFGALAASLCFIVIATIIAWPNLVNNENGLVGDISNNSTTASTQTQPSSNPDKIEWNNANIGDSRVAGTFEKVTSTVWSGKYALDLPESMQFEYYLVYSIPKSNGDSVRLMCGYIERKISENQWLGAYVTTGNKPSVLSNERFKKSMVNGTEVVLGYHEDVTWGAFKAQSHWIDFEAHNYSNDAIISFLEEFIP